MLCVVTVSSCSEAQNIVREYDNGFFITSRDMNNGLSRRTLWHLVEDSSEQVAEFIVVSNMVVALMPTIIQEGDCVTRPLDIKNVVKGKFAIGWRNGDVFPITIGVGSDTSTFKRILQNHVESDMMRNELTSFAVRFKEYSTNAVSVLEVETPCQFELIDAAIAELSRFSGVLAVVPSIRHYPVKVPRHTVPDDLNDIKVDVHGL